MVTGKSGGENWIRDELKEKSDRAVVKAEVKRLDGRIDDLTGRVNEGHSCDQEARIANIEKISVKNQEAVQGMYKWYARGFAAIILVLLTSGAAFIWFLAGLSYNLETNTRLLNKVENRHESEDSQRKLTAADIERVIEQAVSKELSTR